MLSGNRPRSAKRTILSRLLRRDQTHTYTHTGGGYFQRLWLHAHTRAGEEQLRRLRPQVAFARARSPECTGAITPFSKMCACCSRSSARISRFFSFFCSLRCFLLVASRAARLLDCYVIKRPKSDGYLTDSPARVRDLAVSSRGRG